MGDDDVIALSALQHWAYCPRQCGLIYREQVFDDNVHTLRGQAVHAQADRPGFELRRGLRIERALPLFSDRLGLVGKGSRTILDARQRVAAAQRAVEQSACPAGRLFA